MFSRFFGSIDQFPARSTLISFAALVLTGALLLWAPFSSQNASAPISFSDALFTSTSAACVTGLSVRSTGNDFSFVGQVVILLLIQLGGIGVTTISTFLFLRLGQTASLRQRKMAEETVVGAHRSDLRSVLRSVLIYTFGCEALGAAILATRHAAALSFAGKLETQWSQALWDAVFHSVSAFCNAGFGLFDDNLTPYRGDWVVNLTICGLVICGGIGFPVAFDVIKRERDHRSLWERLQLHSKVMLIGTGVLLFGGGAALWAIETEKCLSSMPLAEQALVAFFHSTSARTAGFNTIPLDKLSQAGLFILIVLMFIGGGPCSTAGGSKVSTCGVLLMSAWSRFRGRPHVNLFRRTVPEENIERATAVLGMMATFVVLGLTALLLLEEKVIPFLDLLFETVSALCTVGLSTGITPKLGEPGRFVLVMLMFVGRLGPLSVFIAFSAAERVRGKQYPQEGVLVG